MMKIFSDVRGTFGPKPKLNKWAYEGIIRPKLMYACMTWGHDIRTKALKLRLLGLDSLAARACVTTTRSTPQAGLEVLLGLTPLDLHIESLGLAASIRLRKVLAPPWTPAAGCQGRHKEPHIRFWENVADEYGLLREAGRPYGKPITK